MKKERQFLQDLHRRRVKILPFLHLFQQNKQLRKELFQQYIKTDLKPDYDLFQSSHYSKIELEEGIMAVRKRIPLSRVGMANFIPQTDFEISLHNLKRKYADLVAKDQLPEKFKKHMIEETAIIKELKDLQPVIDDFNLYVVRNKETELKDYAEAFAKNLFNVLQKLNNNLLSKLILEDFIAKQRFSEERIDYLVDNKIDADNAKRKYRQLTMFANNIIYDYLKTLKIENQYLPKVPKVNALFQFIEYLHSNIEKFNQYSDLIRELEALNIKRNKLNPKINYKDKLQYEKLQVEIKSKFRILQDNTANPIKTKAKELNVYDFNNEPIYSFNGIEIEIHQLKENFSHKDLLEIFKHKSKYLEYRNNTHKTFLSLQIFFEDLDEIAISLFDYFKDTELNEFEAFETKAIKVNSISEAVKGFKQGQSKFLIPTPMNESKSRILEQLSDFNFFQITVISDFEFEGKINKDVKQNNNESILTPENWEQHKDTFFKQRMTTYKDSYTLKEKINLELEKLEKLPINKTDYQILRDRYKSYLDQKQAILPQQNEKQKPELNKALISFSSPEIIETLHNELKGYFQGYENELKRTLKGEQLIDFLLFPHNQNKFVEVFKRLKYNGFLLSTPKEINNWICSNFTYQYQRGQKKEVREFNPSTVHDILTKDKGEPTKKERICVVDWLPYKSHLTRQREAEKENF